MLVLRAYGYPVAVLTVVLFVPHPREIFSVYSSQGAFAWLLLHFCWPWVAYVAFMYIFRNNDERTRKKALFALGVISFYALTTILVSRYASQNVISVWGSSPSPSDFWRALNFPLSLLFSFIG
jgi:hypothetical protein